jgi:hypothetical protein
MSLLLPTPLPRSSVKPYSWLADMKAITAPVDRLRYDVLGQQDQADDEDLLRQLDDMTFMDFVNIGKNGRPIGGRTVEEEDGIVKHWSRILKSAFEYWPGGRAKLFLAEDSERIVFGKRPDGDGFWSGELRVYGDFQDVVVLRTSTGFVNGTIIGMIDDLDDGHNVSLFFGEHGYMYYALDDVSIKALSKNGSPMYCVHGPYSLKSCLSMKVLEISHLPMPGNVYKEIWRDLLKRLRMHSLGNGVVVDWPVGRRIFHWVMQIQWPLCLMRVTPSF